MSHFMDTDEAVEEEWIENRARKIARELEHAPLELHEREQIEKDLNLIEAKRALIALIEDAQKDGWGALAVCDLRAALSTVERRLL